MKVKDYVAKLLELDQEAEIFGVDPGCGCCSGGYVYKSLTEHDEFLGGPPKLFSVRDGKVYVQVYRHAPDEDYAGNPS